MSLKENVIIPVTIVKKPQAVSFLLLFENDCKKSVNYIQGLNNASKKKVMFVFSLWHVRFHIKMTLK